MKTYNPPWEFSFATAGTCLYCLQSDRPVLVSTSPLNDEGKSKLLVGVCEACAVHVHWVWRTSTGEVPPVYSEEAVKKITRVKVIIAKLAQKSDGTKLDPAMVNSYTFAMVSDGCGHMDLPSAELREGETEFAAVERSLAALNLYTWAQFVEPLYTAYTPRGQLASVLLVTAWAKAVGDRTEPLWRAWPLKEHVVAGMKGFFVGFEMAWRLRIFKRMTSVDPTEEISVFVREGAFRYINLQRELRAGGKPDDLSMVEYLRKSMSPDEKKIEAQLKNIEENEMALKDQQAQGAADSGAIPLSGAGVLRTNSEEAIGESNEDGGEETGETVEEDDDGDDWPADLPFKPGDEIIDAEFSSPTDNGFVRVGKSLTTEPFKK